MIDPSKITDTMKPPEFRFNKHGEFLEFILPLTKYQEQYLLLKQKDNKQDSVHYYIINTDSTVIGRFDVGGSENVRGITYHIVEDFQNRGIGQITLQTVVEDIFSQNIDRINILAVNERSAAIAMKAGFVQKHNRHYILNFLDYQKRESSQKN